MTEQQIIPVELTVSDIKLCTDYASRCSLGGHSQLRGSDRMVKLAQDQLVGQLGQLALSYYWTGSSFVYKTSRWFADLDPTRGDGGSDFPGTRLDVKTTKLTHPEFLDYHLLVRPKERHKDNVYIFALACDPKQMESENWTILLVGWAHDDEFNGAYAVKAYKLNPLPKITWFL